MNKNDARKLLTPAEFQKIYNISHTSFYREVNAGRLRIIKFGRATRVLVEVAEAWLNARIDGTPGPTASQ